MRVESEISCVNIRNLNEIQSQRIQFFSTVYQFQQVSQISYRLKVKYYNTGALIRNSSARLMYLPNPNVCLAIYMLGQHWAQHAKEFVVKYHCVPCLILVQPAKCLYLYYIDLVLFQFSYISGIIQVVLKSYWAHLLLYCFHTLVHVQSIKHQSRDYNLNSKFG